MKDGKSLTLSIFQNEDPNLTVDRVTIDDVDQEVKGLNRMNAEKCSDRKKVENLPLSSAPHHSPSFDIDTSLAFRTIDLSFNIN